MIHQRTTKQSILQGIEKQSRTVTVHIAVKTPRDQLNAVGGGWLIASPDEAHTGTYRCIWMPAEAKQ